MKLEAKFLGTIMTNFRYRQSMRFSKKRKEKRSDMGRLEEMKTLFVQERGTILKDIDDFLIMVFWFLKEINEAGQPLSGDKCQNLNLLIESLCFIHSLYGYPADNNEDNTGNRILLH